MTSNLVRIEPLHDAIERRNLLVEFVQQVLVKDTDYGSIPGGNRPFLLKPGAEKLCSLFSLVPKFEIIEKTEDWTGNDHNGEAFFYYLYRCQLINKNGVLIAESDGSCNSWEKKYRYRSVLASEASEYERTIAVRSIRKETWIPEFKATEFEKQSAVKREQKTAKSGKLYWTILTESETLIIQNLEVFDQVNTFLKMASKRAFIAATLIAVNASEFFTQDVEELVTLQQPSTTQQVDSISVDKQPQTIDMVKPAFDQNSRVKNVCQAIDYPQELARDWLHNTGKSSFNTLPQLAVDNFVRDICRIWATQNGMNEHHAKNSYAKRVEGAIMDGVEEVQAIRDWMEYVKSLEGAASEAV